MDTSRDFAHISHITGQHWQQQPKMGVLISTFVKQKKTQWSIYDQQTNRHTDWQAKNKKTDKHAEGKLTDKQKWTDRWYLPVQIQKWKHQKNMWNSFKVTPEWHHWRCSGVFIVHIEQISHIFLFPMLLWTSKCQLGTKFLRFLMVDFHLINSAKFM